MCGLVGRVLSRLLRQCLNVLNDLDDVTVPSMSIRHH